MIDAHCHLNDERLLPRVEELLAAMQEHGVTGALVVGYDIPSSETAMALARAHPASLRAAVGIHPHESSTLDEQAINTLHALTSAPEVVALGEIGLDYYYDHSPREVQRAAFRRQLALAREVGLPIIIHERDAATDIMAILDDEGGWALGGSWHCCSVAAETAVDIARHLYVGIAGWITFPKSENIRDLARAVPLERLLIETDAPYITPVPYRGKTNTPAYLRFTADALAQVKRVDTATVDRVTSDNVRRAFPRWSTA
jgi:TatD DNase family protein